MATNDDFRGRSAPLDLYKALIDEVNKSISRVEETQRNQLRDAVTAMEKKADANYELLSARIEDNRNDARDENRHVVTKIDQIVAALSDGNARFAVIEQRMGTVETRQDEASGRTRPHSQHAPHGRPPTDPFPAYRPAPPAPVPEKKKLNPFVVALLGAVAATLGGALATWVVNGGLTVAPRTVTTTIPVTPSQAP